MRRNQPSSILLMLLCSAITGCGDDDAPGTGVDATVDGQSMLPDSSTADATSGPDGSAGNDGATEAGHAADAAIDGGDAGSCSAPAPIAPDEQSCSANDVTCFFAANTEEERQACAQQSETGASCLSCVLLGGAACAYENGCEAQWNDLYCCQQRECANAPFESCPACSTELAARQACETSVAAQCLTAGTTCFPPI